MSNITNDEELNALTDKVAKKLTTDNIALIDRSIQTRATYAVKKQAEKYEENFKTLSAEANRAFENVDYKARQRISELDSLVSRAVSLSEKFKEKNKFVVEGYSDERAKNGIMLYLDMLNVSHEFLSDSDFHGEDKGRTIAQAIRSAGYVVCAYFGMSPVQFMKTDTVNEKEV